MTTNKTEDEQPREVFDVANAVCGIFAESFKHERSKQTALENMTKMGEIIESYARKRVIEELKRLMNLHTRTYSQTVTDNVGNVYASDSHAYISKYETQERLAQLEQEAKDGE